MERPHILLNLEENVRSHEALSPDIIPIDFILTTPVTYTRTHLFFNYKNLADKKFAIYLAF